jgi:glyoxylase-like metal-dependent hydrolase (beta-lactamase superfamily II)
MAIFPLALLGSLSGCVASTHAVAPAPLGVVRSSAEFEADLDQPGPVVVETVIAADWEVDRSGLIDLDHPAAKAAHLKDGPEPIEIYFHVLRHPQRGTFLVDSGVEHALRDDPDHAAIRGIVASVMHRDKMHVRTDTAAFLSREPAPIAGVFLTHLHLDHVSGLPDVPKGTPLYAGPGETTSRAFLNAFVQPNIDRELEGHAPILEWQFASDPAGRFAGVLDVFGDRSVWALWAPGHTPGSTAYVIRTPDGPVLLTGDVCHTGWGWDHDVEPGSFTADHAANAESLHRLRALVARHPKMIVRLGHQPYGHDPSSGTRSALVEKH